MKFVDEKLEKIFKRSNVEGFIEAYAYLKNTGCFTRLECMSNALHYFPENNVNDFGLIIIREFDDTPNYDVHLHKLIGVDHMKDYIEYLNENIKQSSNMGMTWEINEDLFTETIVINQVNFEDFGFITKDYKGYVIRRNQSEIDRQTESRVERHNGGNGVADLAGEYQRGGNVIDLRTVEENRRIRRMFSDGGELAPNDGPEPSRAQSEEESVRNFRNLVGEVTSFNRDLSNVMAEREEDFGYDEEEGESDWDMDVMESEQDMDEVRMSGFQRESMSDDELIDALDGDEDEEVVESDFMDTEERHYHQLMQLVADELGISIRDVSNMTFEEYHRVLDGLISYRG